jgi:ankyrin repeat protein
MGALRLDNKEAALIGGQTAIAIIPGSAVRSLVYRRVSSTNDGPKMPPTGPLTDDQVDLIKRWIDEGASWPDDKPAIQADKRIPALLAAIRARQNIEFDADLAKARDEKGFTLLMQTVLYGTPQQVEALLNKGADPNAVSLAGATPLLLALPDTTNMKLLLDKGAKATVATVNGTPAITLAAGMSNAAAAVKLLLDNGAKPEHQRDPLTAAASIAEIETMRTLLAARTTPIPTGALSTAASVDCLDCVKLLLAAKPPQAAYDAALRTASARGRVEIVQLLTGKADVNAADTEGLTPLMQAAYREPVDPARIKFLLDKGANPNARSKQGKTPLQLAKQKGATEVVKLLEAAGAKQ